MLAQLSQNERIVWNWIWRQAPVSRVELSQLTGLTTGSITRITQIFAEKGLIEETTSHAVGRGSPTRPLIVAEHAAYAYGVSFSHSYLDVGLVSLGKGIVAQERRRYRRATPDAIAAAFNDGIASIQSQHDREALGIGVAVPGDFSKASPYIVAHPYFPDLHQVDLEQLFQSKSNLPVHIENDCNAATLGERVHGLGKMYDNFFNVFLCHGVGGGVIIGGELYRGAHGNAGGLHTFFPMSQPRPSGHDLFDVLSREGVGIRDFDQFELAGALDEPGVHAWIFRSGRQLQDALTRVAKLFDPSVIVIGGRFPPQFLKRVTDIIDTEEFCAGSRAAKPLVLASNLGPSAGVIGAASTVFFRHFFSASEAHASDNILNGRTRSSIRLASEAKAD